MLLLLSPHSYHSKPNGAEQLCDILNRFFSLLVKIVHSFNGDIVKAS